MHRRVALCNTTKLEALRNFMKLKAWKRPMMLKGLRVKITDKLPKERKINYFKEIANIFLVFSSLDLLLMIERFSAVF